MSESLGVKYRPKTLKEICGQTATVKILQSQIDNNSFKNAYLFVGASGCGKAQPLTSRVLTPTGWKVMKDIHPGDIVVSGDGSTSKVDGVYPQGKRPIYRIEFNDNTSIEVADNHLNSVMIADYSKSTEYRKTVQVLTTEQLLDIQRSKPQVRFQVPIPVLDCWQDEDLKVDPYLVGALIGDGSLSGNLGFSSTDPDIVSRVNSILNRDWDMSLKQVSYCDYAIVKNNLAKRKYNCSYKHYKNITLRELADILFNEGYPHFDCSTIVRIVQGKSKRYSKIYPELQSAIVIDVDTRYIPYTQVSNKFMHQLKQYGLMVPAYKKHIPKCYLYSSYNTRLKLLQGLMDTDGDGTRGFDTTSKQLAEDFEFLARSLGIKVTKNIYTNNVYRYKHVYKDGKQIDEVRKCRDTYRFYLHFDNSMQICLSERKWAGFIPFQHPPVKIIKSIKYVRDDFCQCIHIAADCHTYITDGVTLTHNTTAARAFSNAINAGQGRPIEIDAASYSGVDSVRQIVKDAQERSLTSKYKVYICDECHAFSSQGWQAFLKCIEEPPQYTIFIFCTTEVHKVPATIKNRCQVYTFSKISVQDITKRLLYIAEQEQFKLDVDAADLIAKISNGGMRDSIANLERCVYYSNHVTNDVVLTVLGNYSYDTYINLCNALIDNDKQVILNTVENYYEQGADLKLFVDKFLLFVLDVSKYCLFKDLAVTNIPVSLENNIKGIVNIENVSAYYDYVMDKLLSLKNNVRNDVDPRGAIEVTLMQIGRGAL